MLARTGKVWLCNDIEFDKNYQHVCDVDNDTMYSIIDTHAKFKLDNLSYV